MSRRTSVMENLMKVQPSFSAPRSKSFAEWYEKVDEVLDSLQLNDYSFGQTIHGTSKSMGAGRKGIQTRLCKTV